MAALLAAACGGDGAADENEDEARVAEARAAVASATGGFDDPDRVLTLEEYFQRLHVRIRSFELTRANVENTVMAIVLRAQDRLDAVPALREYYEFTASSRGALADQLDGMRPPEAVAAGHGALLANTRAQQAIEMDILDTMAQNVPTSDELEEAETLQAEQRRLEVEAAEICRGLQALATANGVQVTLFAPCRSESPRPLKAAAAAPAPGRLVANAIPKGELHAQQFGPTLHPSGDRARGAPD